MVLYPIYCRKPNPPQLVETGLYGVVRHPLNATAILVVWITPTMVWCCMHVYIPPIYKLYILGWQQPSLHVSNIYSPATLYCIIILYCSMLWV